MPDAARDPLLIALGEELRQAREVKGLTQEALSLQTGVHRNYIGGIERGERQPTVLVVAKLADALEIQLGLLIARAERR